MQKSFRTTLILFGVCVALLAWYFGFEKKWRPQAEKNEEKAKQLVSLTVDQVQLVDLVRLKNAPADGGAPPADFKPEYEMIQLKKSGVDWSLLAPIQDAADSGVANGIVDSVVSTKNERIVEEKPKDLVPFGLKEPFVRVTLKKDSNDPGQQVLIGANTPVGSSSYAKAAGSEAVVRVPRSMRTSTEKTVSELRNKAVLLGLSRNDVSEVEIQSGGENFLLKKESGKDEWTLARDNFPADAGEWGKTLAALIDLKATDFPGSDAKTPSFIDKAKQKGKVVFTRAKDKTKLTLTLFGANISKKDYYYAKRSDKDTVFGIAKDVLEKVARPASAYRSLTLAQFNRYDVKRIRLEKGTNVLELAKDDKNAWNVTGDATAKLDTSKVETLMTKLQDTKIEKYLPGGTGKIGSGATLVVRIFEKGPKGDQEKVVLRFGKPRGPSVSGERADLPLAFLVKESDFKSFNLAKADFLQKEKTAAADAKAPAAPGAPGAGKNGKANGNSAQDHHDHDHGGDHDHDHDGHG